MADHSSQCNHKTDSPVLRNQFQKTRERLTHYHVLDPIRNDCEIRFVPRPVFLRGPVRRGNHLSLGVDEDSGECVESC